MIMEGKKGIVIQFTGKSSSGKSTIANCLAKNLNRIGYKVKIMDERDYKSTMNRDLGNSKEDKIEALNRMARFANILRNDYDVILISAVNPYDHIRNKFKQKYNFSLVHIDCKNEILLNRNLHYNIIRLVNNNLDLDKFGTLEEDFEPVSDPDLVINTSSITVKEAYDQILNHFSFYFLPEETALQA